MARGAAIFRPREIRDDASLAEIRRQLNEIQKEIARDLGSALAARRVTELQLGDYAANYGDVARMAPASGGSRLILPEPNVARLGDDSASVTAVVEAATGALTVEVVNGLINQATTLVFAAGVGSVEFVLTPNGWFGWSVSLVLALPLTALASQAADTFVGRLAGAGVPAAQLLADVDSTSVVYDAASHTFQRAALTGDVTASQDVNATAIANDAVTNAKAANMATPRLKGRTTASTGDPEDLTLTNSTTVSWNTASGGAIAVERAALTGAVTATANSNATAFGVLAAKSVLANATNSSAVPAALAGSAAHQYLQVTAANTGLELATVGKAPQTTAASVTNATTTLGTTATHTIPANTLVVGSRIRVEFAHQFVRGATLTALNLRQYLDLNSGGTVLGNAMVASVTTGTFDLRTVAELTVLTTGAGGTAMAVIHTWGNAFTLGATRFESASNVALAIDTTVANTVRGAADMSAAVANCSITAFGGHVERPT